MEPGAVKSAQIMFCENDLSANIISTVKWALSNP
jgi:hypothetical protein